MNRPLIEICAGSLASAAAAQAGGADRIELCAELPLGGITPSRETILAAKEKIRIPVFVLVRPRGDNFIYSEEELETMLADIAFCKSAGVDGFVFGVLDEKNEIDPGPNKLLLEAAAPLPCTFHRAFDLCADALQSLNLLHQLGFTRLLSSGQSSSAIEGAALLGELVKRNLLTVMPGGGVREENIATLLRLTKAKEFHSALLDHPAGILRQERVRNFKQLLEAAARDSA